MTDSNSAPARVSIPDDPGSPVRRNAVWLTLQRMFQIIVVIWLRMRTRGLDRLPQEGPALLLSNHQSFLDPLLIGVMLRRPVSYLARDSLFRIPVIGWILRNTYVVPLNRDGGATAGIRETIRRMDQGFMVGVFPEGTRSEDGLVGEIKPGFAALIRRTEAPVFPVGVAGANRALGRGAWFLKPFAVCVYVGEPFTAEEMKRLKERGKEDELLAAVKQRLIETHAAAEQVLGRLVIAKSEINSSPKS